MITIIINTKNEATNIKRLLNSIFKSSTLPKEIIVVDNHSTDNTLEVAKTFLSKTKSHSLNAIRYTLFKKGPERSFQKNFGAQKATGKYLLFVDADMTISKNLLKELTKLTSQNLDACIIPEKSVGTDFWSKAVALERNCYQGEPLIESPRFIKKELFNQVKGFDPNLTAAEDWDLRERIKKFNPKIARSKNTLTHHEPKGLLNTTKRKWYYTKYIDRYARKHPNTFAQQSRISNRLRPFWKNRWQLLKHPMETITFLTLKTAIYLRWILKKYEKKETKKQ